MAIPSDLKSQLHIGTIKSSFKVLNIAKDGICWTSLYDLFQCFTFLTERLFYFSIISNLNSSRYCFQLLWFTISCIPLAVIYHCMHTSLLWEEFYFLFSKTPPQGTKDDKQKPVSLLTASWTKLPQLLCVFVQITHMCVYIMCSSLMPVLVAFCWTLSSFSLSREQNSTLAPRFSHMDAGITSLAHWLHSCPQNPVNG